MGVVLMLVVAAAAKDRLQTTEMRRGIPAVTARAAILVLLLAITFLAVMAAMVALVERPEGVPEIKAITQMAR